MGGFHSSGQSDPHDVGGGGGWVANNDIYFSLKLYDYNILKMFPTRNNKIKDENTHGFITGCLVRLGISSGR